MCGCHQPSPVESTKIRPLHRVHLPVRVLRERTAEICAPFFSTCRTRSFLNRERLEDQAAILWKAFV